MVLEEQQVLARVKEYFDPIVIMNNLGRIDLLIMVISNGQKYIYSKESAATRL